MATSSSAKKVARVAAKSGGGSSANKRANWLFPAAIVAIVALGVGVVVYARSENAGGNANDTPPRAQLTQGEPFDHWHAAFAINVCGKEQPPPADAEADVLGIHTHGDGLIHIHPFASRAAGDNATLKRFFDQVGLVVTDEGFETNDGTTYKEGETTCGGKEGELVLAHWKDATTAASSEPDEIYRKDFPSIQLSEDLGAYTLAFEEKGTTDIPAPSTSAQIEQLGAVDGGSTSSDAPEVSGETPIDPGTQPATESTAPAGDTTAPASDTTAPAEGETTETTAAASE